MFVQCGGMWDLWTFTPVTGSGALVVCVHVCVCALLVCMRCVLESLGMAWVLMHSYWQWTLADLPLKAKMFALD